MAEIDDRGTDELTDWPNIQPNPSYMSHLFTIPSQRLAFYLGLFLLGLPLCPFPAHAEYEDKKIVGWIENVQILPENFTLPAKIDTGADNSSLSATDITNFIRSSQKWVRFTVKRPDGPPLILEKPVNRYVKIKRKGTSVQRRPVVHFDICIGTIFKRNVEVNLANRKGFKYPVLIGRSFLKDTALVDSSVKYSQPPHCPKE